MKLNALALLLITSAVSAQDDFRLAPDSPVFSLGFQSIDISKVGPRERFTTSVKLSVNTSENELVNYPNPFSGSTNIELHLEKASHVSVSVMDMAGRTIVNLQEGNLSEGNHRFLFDSTALPKGIYFAKVIANSDHKVVKMISK